MFLNIDDNFSINTTLLQFRIERQEKRTCVQATYKKGEALLKLPHNFDFNTPMSQKLLHKVVVEMLRWQCHNLLPSMLKALALSAGLSYNRLTFKDIKSRWGSCSSLRNINISVWLIMAPEPMVNYVLAHELAHLTEMNHGPRFWAEVDRILGREGAAKEQERQFKAWQKQRFQIQSR